MMTYDLRTRAMPIVSFGSGRLPERVSRSRMFVSIDQEVERMKGLVSCGVVALVAG